jgi:excisionase family DNA binding protein
MKTYFNAQQIAKLEDITASTVVRWIQQGKFDGARKVGREYRIPLESYHAWRESTKLNVRPNERTDAESFTSTTNDYGKSTFCFDL